MTAVSAEHAAFYDFVARHPSFLLTTHVNPDGDGIGSEVATALWLRARGKTVHVLNDSLLPHAFGFLARSHPVESWDPELAERRFTVYLPQTPFMERAFCRTGRFPDGCHDAHFACRGR